MLRKMRRLIGTAEHVTAIADEIIYTENENSYAGGALADSKILVVSNVQEDSPHLQLLNKALNIEKCKYISNCYLSNINRIDALFEIMEGHKFNHIINWIDNVCDKSRFIQKYDVELLYYIMQAECKHFIMNHTGGTVCNAIIYSEQDTISFRGEIAGMKSLINGLGYIMPTHEVLINGMIASEDVPLNEIAHTAIYLSSKYGQILTGEVLTMEGER